MPATRCAKHPEEIEASNAYLLEGLVRTLELLAADPGPRPEKAVPAPDPWQRFGDGLTYGHRSNPPPKPGPRNRRGYAAPPVTSTTTPLHPPERKPASADPTPTHHR